MAASGTLFDPPAAKELARSEINRPRNDAADTIDRSVRIRGHRWEDGHRLNSRKLRRVLTGEVSPSLLTTLRSTSAGEKGQVLGRVDGKTRQANDGCQCMLDSTGVPAAHADKCRNRP